VEIEDYGVGMDEDFMRNRLFKPFDSTKGLTGMGIGAFESREFVRNLGGDIQVHSTPGIGSLFRIVLPYSTMHEETTPLEKEVSGG
jgi:signal transduction histidine kinase